MSVTALHPITAEDMSAAFLSWLKRKGRPKTTTDRYGADLRHFSEWAGARRLSSISATDIDFDFLVMWTKDFEDRRGHPPEPGTRKAIHGVLSSMYRFATNFGFLVDEDGRPVANPMLKIDAPKVPRRRNDWLRPPEDEALLNTPMDDLESILVLFLRWTGLRLDEALSLREQDVEVVSKTIYVDDSKTDSGIRETVIPGELVLAIKMWREYKLRKGLPAGHGLFICTTRAGNWRDPKTGRKCSSAPGQKLTQQQAEKIVRRVGERAGIERLTPHRLRRTYGSDLLNRGVRLETAPRCSDTPTPE